MKTKAQREVIEAALAAIAVKHGGVLKPDDVVAEAADMNSPLHDEFEWDADKAAAAYRIDQARTLIRSVHVVITNEVREVRVPRYVRDPDASQEDQGYVQTVALLDDKERARRVLVDEFGRAAAALKRAREFALAFGMEDEIDAATDTITTLSARVVSRVENRPPLQ